jgi:hypothetical protein
LLGVPYAVVADHWVPITLIARQTARASLMAEGTDVGRIEFKRNPKMELSPASARMTAGFYWRIDAGAARQLGETPARGQ